MIRTEENMAQVSKFFVERMSFEELKSYAECSIKEEYEADEFVFEDDSENMEIILEQEKIS